jgi:hypothetical protein
VLEHVVKTGGLIYAVYLAVFYGSVDEPDEIDQSVRHANIALIDVFKLRGPKRVQSMLSSLLTAEVINQSSSPVEFMRLTDSYDNEYRQRLEIYLIEQVQSIAQCEGTDWREYSDNTFSFQ